MTIWKFEVPLLGENAIDMPRGARILSVQVQDHRPYVWAVVDPAKPVVRRGLRWFATGESRVNAHAPFIGTVQLGSYVFHLFDFGEAHADGKFRVGV